MKLLHLLILSFTVWSADGAKILGMFPYQGGSHNVMFEALMVGLARAGHSVDVVSHFPLDKPVAGFKHISLKGSLSYYANNMTTSFVKQLDNFVDCMHFISSDVPKDMCNLMRLPQLQNILNTETKYDVMITEVFGSNCFLAVAHKLKLPVIAVTSGTNYPWAHSPFFDHDNPSFIPSLFSGYSNQMTFAERTRNFLINSGSKLVFYIYDKTVSEPLAQKYVPDLPSLNDIYYNISLLLVNTHRTIRGVRPGSPSVVEVAGLHIDETQTLSPELERYLNSSKDGVIYFSMGSMLKSESFTRDKIRAIYETFSEMPNYKVLWKASLKEMPEGIPSNVKIIPWVPQYAALRHPNVKVFVTHGGLMGTIEAIHAGVPMVGIPFFADQLSNVAGYVMRGLAVRVNYDDLNKASFSKALHEVLTRPMYKSNIARVSSLFKDRPLSPMDEAVYWIEYVIRNGGDSLKSSALHLYWFQYYLIDVGLFLLVLTTLSLIFVSFIVKKLIIIFLFLKRNFYSIKLKSA